MRRPRMFKTGLVTILALMIAVTASAQVPKRLALEISARTHGKGKKVTSKSVTRRVRTHFIPLLESLGYTVTEVHDAKRAVKKGEYHLSIQLAVDAKPVFLVHEARQYGKHVESQHDTGVSSWAEFKLYGYKGKRQFNEGKVGPVDSRIHESPGGGRAEMDDEDSVSRVLAGELTDVIGELFRQYEEPPLSDDDE